LFSYRHAPKLSATAAYDDSLQQLLAPSRTAAWCGFQQPTAVFTKQMACCGRTTWPNHHHLSKLIAPKIMLLRILGGGKKTCSSLPAQSTHTNVCTSTNQKIAVDMPATQLHISAIPQHAHVVPGETWLLPAWSASRWRQELQRSS